MQRVATVLKHHVPTIELTPRKPGSELKYLPRSLSLDKLDRGLSTSVDILI